MPQDVVSTKINTPKKAEPSVKPPADISLLTKQLKEWMQEPDAVLISEFASRADVSIRRLEELASENEAFAEVYELALTVQEYRAVTGAMAGHLKESTVLRLLERYNNWKKSDPSVAVAVFSGLSDKQMAVINAKSPKSIGRV